MDAMKQSTFGKAGRNFSNLPKDMPGPGKYYPVAFTEASHSHTIPKARPEMNDLKNAHTPGPQTYNNMQGLAMANNQAKTMLGGAIDKTNKRSQ
jgi:hypothetical protein